nr:hypothetical protein [Sphingomonas sp.]
MPFRRLLLLSAIILCSLLFIALIRPVSRDEGQYVAATAFVAAGRLPYRDFAYLQTPLQPFALAPIAWLFPGWLFATSRLANALLGFATVLLVYVASRQLGAERRAAIAAAALLPLCFAFLWAVGLARNDMLPAALLAFAMWVWTGPRRGWAYLSAGIALGLAAGVKISYAVPLATTLAISLFTPGERRHTLIVAIGSAIGLAPSIVIAAIDPSAFFFEAITYPAKAPLLWYTEVGKPSRLGPQRFLYLLNVAALGPALIAAIEVGRAWRPNGWHCDHRHRILLAAAAGGLVSAMLNRPFQPPYLIPALPPLFVLTAVVCDWPRTRLRQAAWAVFIALGLIAPVRWLHKDWKARQLPLISVESASREIGTELRERIGDEPVATLSPEYLVDSGYRLDPRFAAGPFLFRTRGMVSERDAREWNVVARDQVGTLPTAPPVAIVIQDPPERVDPDPDLARQARALGFVPATRVRNFTIWTRTLKSGEGARCRSQDQGR